MNIDFLCCQPLHPASESKAATDTPKRTEPVPQPRPLSSAGCQAGVIMSFAVVDEQPSALALPEAMIQISGYFSRRIILEQLRICPLHVAFRKEGFSGFPCAA